MCRGQTRPLPCAARDVKRRAYRSVKTEVCLTSGPCFFYSLLHRENSAGAKVVSHVTRHCGREFPPPSRRGHVSVTGATFPLKLSGKNCFCGQNFGSGPRNRTEHEGESDFSNVSAVTVQTLNGRTHRCPHSVVGLTTHNKMGAMVGLGQRTELSDPRLSDIWICVSS